MNKRNINQISMKVKDTLKLSAYLIEAEFSKYPEITPRT